MNGTLAALSDIVSLCGAGIESIRNKQSVVKKKIRRKRNGSRRICKEVDETDIVYASSVDLSSKKNKHRYPSMLPKY